MASQAAPALCSTPAYQSYLPLAGFPPAQGWCSTVSPLLSIRRDEPDTANTLLAPPCPLGGDLCALLARLEAAGGEFARGVCCCIGVCAGDEPTAIATIPTTTAPAPTPTSTPVITTSQEASASAASSSSSFSMTYIQRHSSGSLDPWPSSSSSSVSRSSWTYIQRHSSDSLDPWPSSTTLGSSSTAAGARGGLGG